MDVSLLIHMYTVTKFIVHVYIRLISVHTSFNFVIQILSQFLRACCSVRNFIPLIYLDYYASCSVLKFSTRGQNINRNLFTIMIRDCQLSQTPVRGK